MSAWSGAGERLSGTASAPRGGAVALAWIALLAFAVLWQGRWGTVPDASWGILMAEAVLEGKRLYVDLFEVNPPFTLWLHLPPVWLARALGIAPEIVFAAYVYALTAAGLGLAGLVAARARFIENHALLALSPVVLALFWLLPGNAFGEREHIGLALFMPLLALTAWRARAEAPARPGLGLAVFVGLSGSVLLLVKPYYAVLVLAPGLWAAWRRRDPFLPLAPENWVIGAVCAAYMLAVLWLYPQFFDTIYPVLAATYMQVKSLSSVLLAYVFPFAVLVHFFIRLRPREGGGGLAAAFLIAALAALLPLVYQGKGWPYHAYPAVTLICVAFVCLAANGASRAAPAASPWRALLGLGRRGGPLFAAALVAAWAPFFFSQKPDAAVVAAVRAATDRPSVALIGAGLARAHPLTRLVGGRWTSAYISDWLGDFALFLETRAAEAGDAATAERYRAMLDDYVAVKRHEFATERPDIVVIAKEEARWVDVLLHGHGFSGEMAAYRLLAEDADAAVFLRADYRKPAGG